MDTKRMVLGAIGAVLVAGLVARWPIGPSVAVAQQMAAAEQPEADEDPMVREMMVLSISRESAASYADLMGLDELEREVVLEMHRDYLEQYRDAAYTLRDARVAMEEKMAGGMGGGGDMEDFEATMRAMMKVMLGFLDRVMTLGQDYIDDLGALAADEQQQAGHVRVVHAREREMAVAMSMMDGGGAGGVIDLIALGRTMDPPVLPEEGQGPAGEALLAYERELGALCGPFVQRAIAAFREMAEDFSLDDENAGSNEQLEQEMEAMVQRFTTLNDRTVRQVHNALPLERQGEWMLAYNRARWPQVYRPSQFHRAHDAALELEDLTDEQREMIAVTHDQYTREAEAVNKKWVGAIGEAEQLRRSMASEWSQELWAKFQELDQASKEVQADREALDKRFFDRVHGILTEAQRQAMPDAGSDGVDVDAVMRELGGG